MIICYTVPEIWCMTDVIFIFQFGVFLPFTPHPPPTPKKSFQKNEKNAWRYHHFTHVYQKLPPEIWCETDKWTA